MKKLLLLLIIAVLGVGCNNEKITYTQTWTIHTTYQNGDEDDTTIVRSGQEQLKRLKQGGSIIYVLSKTGRSVVATGVRKYTLLYYKEEKTTVKKVKKKKKKSK